MDITHYGFGFIEARRTARHGKKEPLRMISHLQRLVVYSNLIEDFNFFPDDQRADNI